jgi:hypothetical protein
MSLLLVGPVAAIGVDPFWPEPSGHWSGHLASAVMSAGVVVALAIGTALVFRGLPWHALASIAIVFVGLTLEGVGNVRVANSMWATSYNDEEAGSIGPSFPGYEWGHAVAERGDVLVMLGGLALALSLGLSHRVSKAAACTCGLLALFPPWIYPALGSLVLLIWIYARPYRAEEQSEHGSAEPPARRL